MSEIKEIGTLEESLSLQKNLIVPVRKSDGRLRMCIDHRNLNERKVKDRFPIYVLYVWDASIYENGSGAWLLSDAVMGSEHPYQPSDLE